MQEGKGGKQNKRKKERWQQATWPVHIRVEIFFKSFFLKDETEKYFGPLVGRHVSVVVVHYVETEKTPLTAFMSQLITIY